MQESPSQLEGGQTSEDAAGQRMLREQLRKARQHRLQQEMFIGTQADTGKLNYARQSLASLERLQEKSLPTTEQRH